MDKKVLIIGLDGMRPDAMMVARTPWIDKLASNGSYSWNAQNEIRTVSVPAWTSLLTGAHADKHGVDGNDHMAEKRKVPTFFKVARERNGSTRIVAHSHWKPIITEIIEEDVLTKSSSGPDKLMAKNIASDISRDASDIYFVQLDDIDGAGHGHGYSPESKRYVKKIEETDGYIGMMVAAVENRLEQEEWLVCLVSDHGGSGKGHGGFTVGELTIAFIVSGTPITKKGEIPGIEEHAPTITDIVPTVARFLDIPACSWWDGEARGL